MQRWLSGRRARNQRIEAEAEALIRDLGDRAFHEARRREHEASSDAIAGDWAEVALAVARKTGSRIGLDISSQLAMNTFFVLDREPDEARELRPCSEPGPVDEPKRDAVPNSAAVPHPIYRRDDRGRTPDIEGSRDSRLRRVRRDHRRRHGPVAA